MRGAFSVVIDGGYSLGIACRIDPSLQAIGNSDSGKLPVNSSNRIITYPDAAGQIPEHDQGVEF